MQKILQNIIREYNANITEYNTIIKCTWTQPLLSPQKTVSSSARRLKTKLSQKRRLACKKLFQSAQILSGCVAEEFFHFSSIKFEMKIIVNLNSQAKNKTVTEETLWLQSWIDRQQKTQVVEFENLGGISFPNVGCFIQISPKPPICSPWNF